MNKTPSEKSKSKLHDKSKIAVKRPKPNQKNSVTLKKKMSNKKPISANKSLTDMLDALPVERQDKIKVRAKELIAQEMTLCDLRKALKLTQEDLAGVLHIKQEAVSRLERRSDLLLSTLGSYIESMGGKLTLTAVFPNRPAVNLTGFADIEQRNH